MKFNAPDWQYKLPNKKRLRAVLEELRDVAAEALGTASRAFDHARSVDAELNGVKREIGLYADARQRFMAKLEMDLAEVAKQAAGVSEKVSLPIESLVAHCASIEKRLTSVENTLDRMDVGDQISTCQCKSCAFARGESEPDHTCYLSIGDALLAGLGHDVLEMRSHTTGQIRQFRQRVAKIRHLQERQLTTEMTWGQWVPYNPQPTPDSHTAPQDVIVDLLHVIGNCHEVRRMRPAVADRLPKDRWGNVATTA